MEFTEEELLRKIAEKRKSIEDKRAALAAAENGTDTVDPDDNAAGKPADRPKKTGMWEKITASGSKTAESVRAGASKASAVLKEGGTKAAKKAGSVAGAAGTGIKDRGAKALGGIASMAGSASTGLRQGAEELVDRFGKPEKPTRRINLLENRAEKNKKERPETPAEQIGAFFIKFNLTAPVEFRKLNEAQRLKVIQDLKRRIVDIVKSDAQTQYSEALKERVKKDKGVSKIIGSLVDSVKKESEIKDIENKVFGELRNTPEGRALIDEDLERLTEIVKSKEVRIDFGGRPYVLYANPENIPDRTAQENNAIMDFNRKANTFANMPYEWGQEVATVEVLGKRIGAKNRTRYENAKAEYEKAREEILKIKESKKQPGEEGKAMLEVLQINNAIQMEQLLNTHPEFEKALDGFAKSAGGAEAVKTLGGFLNTLTGKNMTNRVLIGGGFGLRMAARGAAIATGATMCTALGAPIIGGVIGGIRGRIRGETTLQEKQKQARHGQKDENKEKARMVDVTLLTNGLKKMVDQVENAKTPEDKAKIVSKLAVVMEHTQDQIEKGQVNFGDTKTALSNQFNLVNNLNRGSVLLVSEQGNVELWERINSMIELQGQKIAGKISEAQNTFIKKQTVKGAAMGAGLATAGYTLRYVGEQFGWWGGQTAVAAPKGEVSQTDTSEGFMERTAKMLERFKFWGNNSEPRVPSAQNVTSTPSPEDTSGLGRYGYAKAGGGVFTPQHQYVNLPNEHHVPAPSAPRAEAPNVPSERPSVPIDSSVKIPPPTIATPSTPEHTNIPPTGPVVDSSVSIPSPTIGEPNAPGTSHLFDEKLDVVHENEGIEHVLRRQIEHDPELAKALGFKGGDAKALHQFSGGAAHRVALDKGYVDRATGEEIRVGPANEIAYKMKLEDGKIAIDEIKVHGGFKEEHLQGSKFEGDQKEDYEYRDSGQRGAGKIPSAETGVAKPSNPVENNFRPMQKSDTGLSDKLNPLETTPTQSTPTPVEAIKAELEAKYPPERPPVEPPVRMRGAPGTYEPYNNPRPIPERTAYYQPYNQPYGRYGARYGEFFPGISEIDNRMLQTHPEFVAGNPFHLTGEKLIQTYHLHQENIAKILPNKENWNMLREQKADRILDQKIPQDPFSYYLHKLREVTGLKPKGANIFHWKGETTEHYIARALQKATQQGRLDEVRVEMGR